MAKIAAEFEKIIHTDRSRRKNEALAAKIFNKDRRATAPIKAAAPTTGGKLAARSGVKKQRVTSTPTAAPRPGNIDSEWTHDLHDGGRARKSNLGAAGATAAAAAAAAPGSLASRISRQGEVPKGKKGATVAATAAAAAAAAAAAGSAQPAAARGRQQRRAAQVANALRRAELHQTQTSSAGSGGLSIRGIATAIDEPLVVMAQNFAPGTTAADIESAMTPVGGLISSCRILKTTPIVIAEIVFESREGAERVIQRFNNQTADGRILHVYHKDVPGNGLLMPYSNAKAQAAPRAIARGGGVYARDDFVVDGSLGFGDPTNSNGFGRQAGNRNGGSTNSNYNNSIHSSNGTGKLYSDDIVQSRQAPGSGPGRRRRG